MKPTRTLKLTLFKDHVNTQIHTLVNTKSSFAWVPKSQSPETKVNMASRHKMIVGSMMVSFRVIHEKRWKVNCLFQTFPFAQWTQRHTVTIHLLFSQNFIG